MEPKVAAQILLALSKGDLEFAVELLRGIGAKGLTLAPHFLAKIQSLYPLKDGKCEEIARRTAEVFKIMGESPTILRITDDRRSLWWHYMGEVMTDKGFHQVTQVGNRVYDKLAGPNGMLLDEYLQLLRTAVGITPVVTTP